MKFSEIRELKVLVAKSRFRNLMETDERHTFPEAVVESAAKRIKTLSVSCNLLYYALVLASFWIDNFSRWARNLIPKQAAKPNIRKIQSGHHHLACRNARETVSSPESCRNISTHIQQSQNSNRVVRFWQYNVQLTSWIGLYVRREDNFKTNRKCNAYVRLCTAFTTCLKPVAHRPSFDSLYDCSYTLSNCVLRLSLRCWSFVRNIHERK